MIKKVQFPDCAFCNGVVDDTDITFSLLEGRMFISNFVQIQWNSRHNVSQRHTGQR